MDSQIDGAIHAQEQEALEKQTLQVRCPFCGALMFNCNLMSEGPDKTVKFKYCGECKRGYRTNFLGGGRKFILHTYVTKCYKCKEESAPFDIDGGHPTVERLIEAFFDFKFFLCTCSCCGHVGDHEIIQFDSRYAEEAV